MGQSASDSSSDEEPQSDFRSRQLQEKLEKDRLFNRWMTAVAPGYDRSAQRKDFTKTLHRPETPVERQRSTLDSLPDEKHADSLLPNDRSTQRKEFTKKIYRREIPVERQRSAWESLPDEKHDDALLPQFRSAQGYDFTKPLYRPEIPVERQRSTMESLPDEEHDDTLLTHDRSTPRKEFTKTLYRHEIPVERQTSARDSSSDEELDDVPISTYTNRSSQIKELKRNIRILEKDVEQQKLVIDELFMAKKDYKENARKLKDELSAVLTRKVLPTQGLRNTWDPLPVEGLDDVPLSTSEDQSAQIEELKRHISRLENIVRKLKDDFSASLTRERTHAKPDDIKKGLEHSLHILGKLYDDNIEELEQAQTKVRKLENDIKSCVLPEEKERLQEELTRKKEEVRQLKQYNEVMEKRQGVLKTTIQMLKQDSPKTDDYNISLKKLIKEEAELQIESEIMKVQLQQFVTVTDAPSETDMGELAPITKSIKGPFIRRECEKNKFLILKYACETIQGILTICEQDLDARGLLYDKLCSFMSADSIQVYTTQHFLHHFNTGAMEEDHGMSENSVVASIGQTSTFTLFVVSDEMCASVVNALNNSDISNAGVLIVGDIKDLPVIPNVFFGKTKSEKIMKEADYVLERCAFGILKTAFMNLQQFESSRPLSELEKASLQEVYDQIHTYFKECAIPGSECPDIPRTNFEYPKNIDQAIEVIKGIPFIIGCVKKRGRLQIYIEASAADSGVEENVRRKLTTYEVGKYDFVYRTVEPLCSSGDSAFGGQGTLGGFVKKVKLPDASVHTPFLEPMAGAVSWPTEWKLVALVSRHVANGSGSEYLTVGTNLRQIGRIVPVNTVEAIDVLPVDVYDECKNDCDTRFKNDLNVSFLVTKLTKNEDLHNLIGMPKPVHFWGAVSAPGRGTLTPGIFQTRNVDRIIIRDRRSDEPFAQNGDSGAMVCYFDPRQEELYAVAMLVELMTPVDGSQNREYVAEILDIALQKLSLGNGYQLVFFKDDDP